jgi:hypothetical protein
VDRPNQILPERVFKEDSVISTVSSSTLQADYDLDVLAQLEDDVVHNKEWEIEDDFIIKASIKFIYIICIITLFDEIYRRDEA